MIELPPLPYSKDALAPHISAETLDFHHGKHHKTYVDNVNRLVTGTPHAEQTLEQIIMASSGPLFDSAAQVWNHTFYWNSMRPSGGGEPTSVKAVHDAIVRDFGTYAAFRDAFKQAALTQFGSGWAWLVQAPSSGGAPGKLSIMKTANADLPMKHGQKALLTIDVWEHAYYIDYRNARGTYADTFLDKLVNWEFVAKQMA